MKISEIIEQKQRLEFDGNFGLEKESLRVDEKGFLAHTSHPFLENKNIDRDFCSICDGCNFTASKKNFSIYTY